MVASRKSRKPWSERVILLGPDECQSSRHSVDLGNLPGDSNNEDRLQARTEVIRIQKYLRKKLLPPHLMHCSSFPGRINVEKTSEQCFQPLPFTESKRRCSIGHILECRVG